MGRERDGRSRKELSRNRSLLLSGRRNRRTLRRDSGHERRKIMDLASFDFPFPKELVAQRPLPRREDSRMMVVDRLRGEYEHRAFGDFPSFLKKGDVLVL